MSPLYVVALIFLVLVYLVVLFLVFRAGRQKDDVVNRILARDRNSGTFIFTFERKLLDRLNLRPEKAGVVLWAARIVLGIAVTFLLVILRGLGFTLCAAVIMAIVFEDLYRKQLYDSGVMSVSRVTNFLDFFVPHITSGNSADQSMLEYIEYADDAELSDCFENRESPDLKIPAHYRQIFEIYDIAKYNEEKGINDYSYILNDIAKDISQKQQYYNRFVSRIGEIKPIEWAYYLGVPALIVVSYGQTRTFWQGFGGLIVGIVLLVLFGAFKYLIYRLQCKTLLAIF